MFIAGSVTVIVGVRPGASVGVGVSDAVFVRVIVGVSVAVVVLVGTLVSVAVSATVSVGLEVGVSAGVSVAVVVNVSVAVAVLVKVGVFVADGVSVSELLTVGVGVSVRHRLLGEELLRAPAIAVEKSSSLLSVSVHPLFNLKSEFELPGAGARPAPSKLLADTPYPTKSIIAEFGKQSPEMAPQFKTVVEFTSATFPAVAFIKTVPVASGVGRAVPLAPPDAI